MSVTEKAEAPPSVLPGSDVLTNSSITTFAACRKLYYWQYEMGWRPAREAQPLRFGGGTHMGLDRLSINGDIEAACGAVEDAYQQRIMDFSASPAFADITYELELEATTIQRLLAGYADAYKDSPLEIVASETTFDLPIINPETGRAAQIFRQAGRRDRLARLPDGDLVLLETKTAAEDIGPDSDFRKVLSLNQQLSMYTLAARAEGLDISRIVYDVIRKPTIKPTMVPVVDEHGKKVVLDQYGKRVYTQTGTPRQTSDENRGYALQTKPMTRKQWRMKLTADIEARPDYYFQRFEVPRLESDLDEFRHELWDIAQTIHTCRKTGRWFRNTGACRRYNRLCDYYQLCSGETDTTNGCPAGFRQAEQAHEELADEGSEA